MNGRIEKIKTHLSENKVTYLSCGATAVVTGLMVYVYKGKIDNVLVQNKITQVLSWKPNATIEVYVEALGDPGNIIQDLTTGSVYASQGQAARELGLSAPTISKHLNGKTTHVKGHIFERISKAAVKPL
jgi:hypothetical protein